jgi:prepilin-type N-terminal cleavage/methylation domain-containing protein
MRSNKGFTLAEIAVAMVIVALLLAGAIIPLRTQIDVRNTADTQRSMDAIKEAIIGYALANGRLPCPADGTIPAGGVNSGTEQYNTTTGQCADSLGTAVTFGVVPWATLGVSETDAWGRRFSYYVVQTFADKIQLYSNLPAVNPSDYNTPGQTPCNPAPMPTVSSFALCTLGNLTVNTRNDSTHAATAIGSVLPAVIISHGKNGYGAYTPGGLTLAAPAAGTDEAANATYSNGATTFYSRTPTPSASGCSDAAAGPFCEFDDIIVMISTPTLAARMVNAGKLP